jgi:hypothetical protein
VIDDDEKLETFIPSYFIILKNCTLPDLSINNGKIQFIFSFVLMSAERNGVFFF